MHSDSVLCGPVLRAATVAIETARRDRLCLVVFNFQTWSVGRSTPKEQRRQFHDRRRVGWSGNSVGESANESYIDFVAAEIDCSGEFRSTSSSVLIRLRPCPTCPSPSFFCFQLNLLVASPHPLECNSATRVTFFSAKISPATDRAACGSDR